MDKAHLITYLISLAFIVSGLIVCCILYLFKDKINKITPDNIDNINSNVKDFVSKNIKNVSSFNSGSSATDNYHANPSYGSYVGNIYNHDH
ncbi:TPA: hypothetical protein RZH69_001702 [Campylobacter coli]|uniref:hypothetical protein n=1 Tax=Campylobacter coli TaxID=195 RepID=UPI00092FA423|nr:hypothetical protein [Campylobacter coli]EII8775818.1 hypothetical protein [Campylobacter coli]HEB7544300.1 hypothetical protein [Campylobacter coli]HEB7554697.1 hypothetical protein [Campylobacter coli]HEB7556313.1 hypothetical protein [Campylobacter coli]